MSENRNLSRSIKKIWDQTSIPARISIVGVSALSIALMVGVGYWSVQPQYVPLRSDLNPKDAASVISILESNGIQYKRNYSGTGILVDQKKFGEANQLVASVVQPDQLESDSQSSHFGGPDPQTLASRQVRAKELALEKTISQLTSIESATVHLGVPDPSPFVKKQSEKTASVTVKIRSKAAFTGRVPQAIIQIVANGVEGLRPENISLQDTDGNTYSSDEPESGGMSSQPEYRARIERQLTEKAESVLVPILGYGKVVIRITADIDFTKVIVDEQRYDSDAKVPRTEETTSTKLIQNDPLTGTGTGSNIGGGGPGRNQSVNSVEEHLRKEYDNGLIRSTKTLNPGTIERLTIAAVVQLVDSADATDADGKSPATAATEKMSLADAKKLIQNAVGFDASRNDEIEVLAVTNLDSGLVLEELIEPVSSIESMMPIIRNASLGIAALVALVLGFMTIKKIRPLEIVRNDETAMTPQRARQLSDLAVLARKNPDLVSSIMSAWINNDEAADRSASGSTSARKAA